MMSHRQNIKAGTTRSKNLREARREREVTAQKERRCNQHMRRRGPLVEVQEDEEPSSVKSKIDRRTERLRAWQKTRDERKRQDKLKKKEPFRFGMMTRPFYLDPVDKPAISNATRSKQAQKSDTLNSGPVTRSRSGNLPSSKISTASETKTQSYSTCAKQTTKKKEAASLKQPTSTNAKSSLSQQVSSVPQTELPKPSTPPSPPGPTVQPCPIQDSAWIPGATVSTQNVPIPAKAFDEVFGDSKGSSPFLFGHSKSKTQPPDFTFLKRLKSPSTTIREMSADPSNNAVSDESMNDEQHRRVSYTRLSDDLMDDETATENQVDDKEQSSVKKERTKRNKGAEQKKERVKEDKATEQSIVENERVEEDKGTEQPHQAEQTIVDNEDESTDKQTKNACDIDFPYFRALYCDVKDEFQSSCQLWNRKLEDLDDIADSEQVIEQIRITVCQAQLLVRSKMKQYLGLVEKAEDGTAVRKTTAEDLQGFWDMVYYQVTDIRGKFNDLTKLEENNWKIQPSSPVHPQPRRSKRKVVVSKPVAAPSEKLEAARQKREAERKRLREQMAAMKKSKASVQETPAIPKGDQDKEDTVYSPPPSSPRSTLSSIPSARRRRSSARLRNKV